MNKAHESHIQDTDDEMNRREKVMQEDGCTQREVPILNREVKDRMTKRMGCEQQTWRRGQWAMWRGGKPVPNGRDVCDVCDVCCPETPGAVWLELRCVTK